MYIIHNQKRLRGETYKRLCEDVHAHSNSTEASEISSFWTTGYTPCIIHWQPSILPCTFPRCYGHCVSISQTRFLYYSCNPQWSEIQNSQPPGQHANDRPDIITRVFNQKLNHFIQKLKIGAVLAFMYMYVIEFQKRGLPHCTFY